MNLFQYFDPRLMICLLGFILFFLFNLMDKRFELKEFPVILKSNIASIVTLILLLIAGYTKLDLLNENVNKIIVGPIISKIENIWILLPIPIVFIGYYCVVFYYERAWNRNRYLLVLAITTIYACCSYSDYWLYESVFYSLNIRYLDIFFILFNLEIIFFWNSFWNIRMYFRGINSFNWFLTPNNKLCFESEDGNNKSKLPKPDKDIILENYSFQLEREIPIDEESSDLYNLTAYNQCIRETLQNSYFSEGSFAIGISGTWGSGKSSFMNLLRKNNEHLDIECIEFKPWFCETSADITHDFFKLFRRHVSLFAPELNSQIKDYARELSHLGNSKVSGLFNMIMISSKQSNPQLLHENISSRLQRMNKKFLIIIDDLDRLQGQEIIEVMRIIRNSADFPFVQFVVAYDKNYLIKTLEKHQIAEPARYIEKIFNLEISLPKSEDSKIHEELAKRLNYFLIANNLKYEYFNHHFFQECSAYTYLKNIRDVIRFCNAFELNILPYIKTEQVNEIFIHDFFYIELLRYCYFDLYQQIKNQPLSIFKIEEDNKSYLYLYSKQDNSDIPSLAADLLEKMFKEQKHINGINRIDSFFKYFGYRLDDKTISSNAFISIVFKDNSMQYIKKNCTKLHKGLIKKLLLSAYANIKFMSEKLQFETKLYELIKHLLMEDSFQDEVSEVIPEFITVKYGCSVELSLNLWLFVLQLKYPGDKLIELYENKRFKEMLPVIVSKHKLQQKLACIIDNSITDMIDRELSNVDEPYQFIKNIDRNNLKHFLLYNGDKTNITPNRWCEIFNRYLRIHYDRTNMFMRDSIEMFQWYSYIFNKPIDEINKALYRNRILENMEQFCDSCNYYIFKSPEANTINPRTYNRYINPGVMIELFFDNYDDFEEVLGKEKYSDIEEIITFRDIWDLYKYNGYEIYLIETNHNDPKVEKKDLTKYISYLNNLKDLDQKLEETLVSFNNDLDNWKKNPIIKGLEKLDFYKLKFDEYAKILSTDNIDIKLYHDVITKNNMLEKEILSLDPSWKYTLP